ncbi:hypothetical protein [Floricoccus tropicus]|uniref:hypothetical protein n=1 Tax=Floricoccus tropicus TaxID=1859473 RepID=UPI0013DE522B|nr:hypothetical protein [Floricoccus tropicus]
MPKYKVRKKFQDIHTNEIYEVGQEIDILVKRAEEVENNLDGSFLERIIDKKEEADES